MDEFFSLSEKERKTIGLKMREVVVKETSYDNLKEQYLQLFVEN
jgi:hypothetical protein